MNAIVNTSGIEPVGDLIRILPDEVEFKSEGGIVLPDMVTDKEQMRQVYARVVAIGPEAWHTMSPRCFVGDHIYFSKFSGDLFQGRDGKEYRIIKSRDVVAKTSFN